MNRRGSAAATLEPARRLGRTAALVGVAYAFLVVMLGTTLPTPLYPIYERRFGFTGLIVTIVFATYALGVIAALLLVGRASDQVGRRPVLLVGLAFAALSSVVFLVASALAPVLIGRVLSGISAGVFTGTATATLVDFSPAGDRSRGTLVATAANQLGLGSGPLLAGLLAQFAPDPLRLPYAVHLGLLIPAAAAVVLMPEPVQVSGRVSLRVQRLSVPRELRPTFLRVGAAAFAAFAVLGLFTAVAPAFLGTLLGLPSHWLAGTVVFGLFACSLLGQLALDYTTATRALPIGCAAMVVGSGVLAGGIAASSLTLFLAGAAIAGFGVGLCFRAGLATLNSESPPGQRAAVASSYFVVSYVAISVPIVGIGVAAQEAGLRSAGIVFTGLVGLLALGVMASLVRRS